MTNIDYSAILSAINSDYGTIYVPTLLGAIIGLVLDRGRRISSERFRLWAYIILPLGLIVAQPVVIGQTAGLAPRGIDRLLGHWDDVWFGGPALVWAKLVWGHGLRVVAVSLWYYSLPMMMPIGVALARRPEIPFVVYLLLGLGCNALYWCFPAIGPIIALQDFPCRGEVWAATPTGFYNAFPSLHTAGAMTALFSAKPRLMPFWGVYAAGIVFCCVSTGQHWLVDCIAGMALAGFAVAVSSLMTLPFGIVKPSLSTVDGWADQET